MNLKDKLEMLKTPYGSAKPLKIRRTDLRLVGICSVKGTDCVAARETSGVTKIWALGSEATGLGELPGKDWMVCRVCLDRLLDSGDWVDVLSSPSSSCPPPYAEPAPKEFVKNDSAKNPLHLLPTVALESVGEVLAFGAKKYTEYGWRTVDKRSRYYSAVIRHLFAWWRGENLDPESGLPHLSHAACSVLFLLEANLSNLGADDRPTPPPAPTSKESP
jgi:hypothetical protein